MIINNSTDRMSFNFYCKDCIHRYDDYYRYGCYLNKRENCDEDYCPIVKQSNDIYEFIDKINTMRREGLK